MQLENVKCSLTCLMFYHELTENRLFNIYKLRFLCSCFFNLFIKHRNVTASRVLFQQKGSYKNQHVSLLLLWSMSLGILFSINFPQQKRNQWPSTRKTIGYQSSEHREESVIFRNIFPYGGCDSGGSHKQLLGNWFVDGVMQEEAGILEVLY